MSITMKMTFAMALFLATAGAQIATHEPQSGIPKQQESNAKAVDEKSDDVAQLRADLQQMKVLLNQMRTNLAFVQTSQTPLKHQFELETDAWQVIVEQMERRLERIEKSQDAKPAQK
jgi:hypothetical protein